VVSKVKLKWVIILGVVLVIAVAGFVVTQILPGEQVEVHRVNRDTLEESITEEGTLVSEDQRTIFSLHTGIISELLVEEGDRVNRGDLLVVLDTQEIGYTLSELHFRLRGINSELELMRHNRQVADDNLNRTKALYEQNWASRIELEEAESVSKEARTGVESLEAQYRALNSQIRAVEHRIDNHHIYAPISGVVTNLEAEEEGLAGPQAPLMHLIQSETVIDHLFVVEVRVLTRDIEDIRVGDTVTLTFERRDEDLRFSGQITKIAPFAVEDISPLGLEEERVTVTIRPDLPPDIVIGPGYKVDVEFITDVEEDVLIVPRRALFTYEDSDAVLVIEEGRARVRKVVTGLETRLEAAIVDGLMEGEIIVLDPGQEDVEDGSRVRYDLP
jgi:HlyD family secretion protein